MNLTISITIREENLLYFEEKNGWGKLSQYVNENLEKALIKNINFNTDEFNLSAGLNINRSILVEVNIYKAFMLKYGKGKVSKYINSCIIKDIENEAKETGKEAIKEATKTEAKAETKTKNSIKAKAAEIKAKKENNPNGPGKAKSGKDKKQVIKPLPKQKKAKK